VWRLAEASWVTSTPAVSYRMAMCLGVDMLAHHSLVGGALEHTGLHNTTHVIRRTCVRETHKKQTDINIPLTVAW
jgi:hypothetical protein